MKAKPMARMTIPEEEDSRVALQLQPLLLLLPALLLPLLPLAPPVAPLPPTPL
jgi:hypothetical protein